MCTGFPRPGVLRRLRPTRAFGRRRLYPRTPPWHERDAGNARGWFPRSLLSGRRVRHPALPLRHRHGYAAANSPWPPGPGRGDPAQSSPPVMKGGAHRTPALIHWVRAGGSSRGVTQPVPRVYLPVSLTTPGPSGSTELARLRRGCSHPPRRPPAQAVSSFTPPLRRRGDKGLSPPSGTTAPRGAPSFEPRHGEAPAGRHVVRKPSPAGRQAVREPAHRDLSTLRPDSLPSRPGRNVYQKSQLGGSCS